MKAKKIKKMNKYQVERLKVEHKTKWLTCTTCENKVKVDESVIAVKCHICTAKLAPMPKQLMQSQKQKSDKPAGWRFMAEFVDKDGNVFHTGEEQPELKGTLAPSDVEKIREEQKKKRKESKVKKEKRAELKEERMAKAYEKKMKAKKKEEVKKQEKVDTDLGRETKPAKKVKPAKKAKKAKKVNKTKKAKSSTASVRYEKFEEPRIATDREQIQKLIESEGAFSEHLQKRQINVSSIAKIYKSSYAAIDNQTGVVKNKRRGYKVTLQSGDVNIINITVK